jgi:glycosyltransferase involved in cell wall biosynthesis
MYLRTMKRVLILTYYWPPSGGAGVQRWLKFVKYLRQFGWEPIVYTADNPEYPVFDASLSKDIPKQLQVLKVPIWEPYQLYKKLIGQKKDERVVSGFLQEKGRKSWAQNLSLWIRGNVFIPDARRFWIRPSVNYLTKWLNTHPVDAIVSTGPPHSMHLIARDLHRKTGIPWLADFRDPWVNIDFAGDLNMSAFAARRNRVLEKAVLQEADMVTVVSAFMREEFLEKTSKPIHVITNGYDPDDFEVPFEPHGDGKFRLVHTGSLNNRRDQPALWKALHELTLELPGFADDFRIRLIGKNDVSVSQSIAQAGLSAYLEQMDYVPHSEIVAEQKKAQVLLLSINNYGDQEKGFFSPKATLTGKLFEYLAAGRPILMVGPTEGQAALVITEGKAGAVCDFDAVDAMKSVLSQWYRDWKNGIEWPTSPAALQFSRKTLCGHMARVLDTLVENKKGR